MTTSGRRTRPVLIRRLALAVLAVGIAACDSTPTDSAATAPSTAVPSRTTELTMSEPVTSSTTPSTIATTGPLTTAVGSSAETVDSSECRGAGSSANLGVQYEEVDGVDPDLLSMDIYEPVLGENCAPAPMVVFVHGGGFVIGDKSNKIDDKVSLFTAQGWVFASVNYRLSPTPPDDIAGQVRYPTHEQDVAEAVAWLQQHAADYNGDPTRIMLVGHSSGAFIVSLLSTDTTFLEAAGVDVQSIRCTVALDTEYDITNQVAQGGSQEMLYRNAFGTDPATWMVGSPINHTEPASPRPDFLIFTQGTARRTAQAQTFAAALTSGGTFASVIDVNPLDHEQINASVGAPGDTIVTPPLLEFLHACA